LANGAQSLNLNEFRAADEEIASTDEAGLPRLLETNDQLSKPLWSK
jgi:hypothetical protein